MNDRPTIPANERGVIRLFALDDQLAIDIAHTGLLDRLYRALGVETLNDADVQIVRIPVIADMGLPVFLAEAYDVDPAESAARDTALRALTGTIAILRSGAFGGQKVQLGSDGEATLVVTFNEPGTDWTAAPMQIASARSRIPPRVARSQARRIGFSLFTVIMLLIAALVVWLAT